MGDLTAGTLIVPERFERWRPLPVGAVVEAGPPVCHGAIVSVDIGDDEFTAALLAHMITPIDRNVTAPLLPLLLRPS